MIGEKFGKLTAIAEAPRNRHGQRMMRCRCDCGTEKTVNAVKLKYETRSCGCISKAYHDQWSRAMFGKNSKPRTKPCQTNRSKNA